MCAPKADVVQLAVMKWMNAALNENQDTAFPEAKVKGLIKNFLKLKEWVLALVERSFTTAEEELLKDNSALAEGE